MCAGQVCVVLVEPELDPALAAGVGEGLAAKTLAAPKAVSIPATASAARKAFVRDGDRAVRSTSDAPGSIPAPMARDATPPQPAHRAGYRASRIEPTSRTAEAA